MNSFSFLKTKEQLFLHSNKQFRDISPNENTFFPSPYQNWMFRDNNSLSRFQSETPEQPSKLFYLFEYRRHLKFESHSRRRRGGKNYGQIPLMVVPEVFMFAASIHQFKCKFEIFSPVLMLNLYPRTVISIYMGYFELQLLLLSGFCCFTSMNFCILLLLCFINILKENPIVSFTSFFFFGDLLLSWIIFARKQMPENRKGERYFVLERICPESM